MEGTPSLLCQGPLNASAQISGLCVFFRVRRPSCPGPLHTRQGFALPPSPAGEGVSSVPSASLIQRCAFRNLLSFTRPSSAAPCPLLLGEGAARRRRVWRGHLSLLYQGPLNASAQISGLCVFFCVRRPSCPGPLHTRQGFALPPSPSRRGLCSVPLALFFFTEAGEPDCLAHAAELLIHVPV